MLTLLNKISKIADKGQGVQKVQKYADVICESPLRGQLNYDPLECPVENLTYLEKERENTFEFWQVSAKCAAFGLVS